tara:strand:- start:730 stop:1791 length:1062 start_codon:yes stop_codon:yes gene_type:complete
VSTNHEVLFADSSNMKQISDDSIDLMVTSPPYPMVSMWDQMFIDSNQKINEHIESGDSSLAFEDMHKNLDSVWLETYRVLKEGGIACINIGDATRTIRNDFQLFNSHSRIINYCLSIGFVTLPSIIWRKQTNSPNKFMGSGMLPVGAYVTLEHEHIIVLRKGKRRTFDNDETKQMRRESAFFWEERNTWFSDLWFDVKGTKQSLADNEARNRSAAYPFELVYRLINMFSIKGDRVLDPFLGTGTTTLASLASERNSIGFEIEEDFRKIINDNVIHSSNFCNSFIDSRIKNHSDFIEKRIESGKEVKYHVKYHDLPCITKQEMDIKIRKVNKIEDKSSGFLVTYNDNFQSKLET